jgi:hypothetical protein
MKLEKAKTSNESDVLAFFRDEKNTAQQTHKILFE